MSGRDCFDCEYAEYDVEEYFGGYREKIVIGCNSPDECTEDKEEADRVRGKRIEKKYAEPQESKKVNCKSTKCENCINHNYCDYEPRERER